MATTTALGLLADLAEAQASLVTTRQAQDLGVARRDLARLTVTGGLERIAHGVYRVAGAPRPRLVELRAAWLQLAPGLPADERTPADGVISHGSAAAVYDVGLLEPTRHEFTFPPARRVRSRRSDVTFHSALIKEAAVDWVDAVLVTTPIRLVTDLCVVHTDGDHLAGIVFDLVERGLATRRDLATALRPHARSYAVEPSAFLSFLLNTARTQA